MIKIRNQIILLLIILLSCSGITAANSTNSFTVSTDAAVFLEAERGQILFNKNGDQKLPIASLTKIMTVFVVLERVNSGDITLQDRVTATDAAESMGGSQIWLASGEEFKLRDLLKAVLLPSANDASVAVAEYIGGTQENFVDMMNQKAQKLGLEETQFVNCTGLPEKTGRNQSTAYELGVLSQKLINKYK